VIEIQERSGRVVTCSVEAFERRAREYRLQLFSDIGIDPQKLLDYANAAHAANQHVCTISSNTLAIIARALGAKDE